MINLIGKSEENYAYECYKKILKEKLTEGIHKCELIYTQGLRNVGKTYQLIEFAKENNYVVVVKNEAYTLSKMHNYKNIFNENSNELRGIRITDCIIDEGIDKNRLEKEMGIKVLTGFTNKKGNEDIGTELSLNDKIIKSLENDIKSLLDKLEGTLRNDNFSNYKMLINNLKDTVNLKSDLEDISNHKTTTINVGTIEIPNASSAEEIKRSIENFSNPYPCRNCEVRWGTTNGKYTVGRSCKDECIKYRQYLNNSI